MRPNTNVLTVEHNLPGESREMSMDPRAIAHLASVLSGLYQDQLLACVREYSTNAMDSHIEAGVSRPIEVWVPTHTARNLVIQDFGTGMSKNDLFETYSMYGASTKRESADFNGMLGLGSKSALALVSQFTVTSVKAGRKVQVLVAKNSRGIGELTILTDEETDEGNGVTISIPVNSHEVYRASGVVEEFFKYWPSGTVKINGVENKNTLLRIDDTYCIDTSKSPWDDAVIVMGGVAYSTKGIIHATSTPSGIRTGNIVAYVDINGENSVDFSPSRESLLVHDQNKAVVDRLFREALDEAVEAWMEAPVAKMTKAEQAEHFSRMTQIFSLAAANKMLPNIPMTKSVMESDKLDIGETWFRASIEGDAVAVSGFSIPSVQQMSSGHYHIVLGCEKTRAQFVRMTNFKKRLRKHGGNTYVFVPAGTEILHTEWFPADKIIKWSDIEEIYLEPVKRNATPTKRVGKGKVFAWTKDNQHDYFEIEIDDLINKKVFVVDAKEAQYYSNDLLRAACKHLDAVVIKRYARDTIRVEKNFPDAKGISDIRTELGDFAKKAAQTPLGIAVLASELLIHFTYNKVTGDMIDDPDIKKALDLRENADFQKKQAELQSLSQWMGGLTADTVRFPALDKYPLLQYLEGSWYSTDKKTKGQHIANYVNMVYAHNKKEQV